MITPVKNNVALTPCPSESVSKGGIFVPDSYKTDSHKMTIVAVGSGTPDRPMQFEVGQTAYRVKDWGHEVNYNGQKIYFMQDKDILTFE